MNFFKRATTSILRRPGKTIILLLLVFILGSVIAGAISVEGAISNTDANLRSRMQPIVSIGFDHEAWNLTIDWEALEEGDMDPWLQQPRLTPTHVREIGALPYVAFYDYMITAGLRSFELERYEGGESWRQEGMPEWFSLRGTSNTEIVKIEEGIIDLVNGRQFEAHELTPGGERAPAIISEAFANQNNLSIGSVFELYEVILFPTDPDDDQGWFWGPEMYEEDNIYARVGMEFEVVGLYDILLDPEMTQNDQEYWSRRNNLNNIYVPNWALEDVQRRSVAAQLSVWDAVDYDAPDWVTDVIGNEEAHQTRILPLFILEDPAHMDEFRAAAEDLLPEYHIFEDLSSAFDDIASSMATLQSIADWILYVSIGATLLILSLLITLFLRDRRYEMGVYLALGEKKGRIISQILMEVVVTSVIGITLAVFAGNLISGMISQNMLSNELRAQVEQDDNMHWGGDWTVFDEIGIPTNDMSVDEMMEAFEVSLSIETIGLFYAVGLGAVILSTMMPVVYVVTLNPKKVLM